MVRTINIHNERLPIEDERHLQQRKKRSMLHPCPSCFPWSKSPEKMGIRWTRRMAQIRYMERMPMTQPMVAKLRPTLT